MYEIVVGLIFGVLFTRVLSKKNSNDVSTQVDSVSFPTVPIPIPNSKKSFTPGALTNFWGKDS